MRDFDALRRELALHGLSADQLDELADHAACARDRLIEVGVDPDLAERTAREALGTTAELALEYRRVHAMSDPLRFLAVLVSLAVFAAVTASSQSALGLLDASSLLLVGGSVCASLCASFGPAHKARALRDCLRARSTVGLAPAQRELHLAVVRRGHRLAWVSGALGALAGAIRTLMNLSDPSEVGAAAAVALLSVLYGALLAEVGFANAAQWLAQPAVQHAD